MAVITGYASSALSEGAQAAEVGIGADIASSYVWRGITINKDPVIQPSLEVVHPSGIGLEIWSNMDMGDDDGVFEKRQFSEIDLTAFYSFDLDYLSVTIGYIEYLYPGQTSVDIHGVTRGLLSNREIFAGVDTEPVPGLTVGLTGYYEIEEWRDIYVVAEAAYEMDVTEKITAGVNGSIGYAGGGFSENENSGLHDYLLGASSEYAFKEDLSFSIFVYYVDSARSKTLPGDLVRENWIGGISAYHTF